MITYKYSSKLKFLLIVLLGTIKSSEYVILAYIVGTLTIYARIINLDDCPGSLHLSYVLLSCCFWQN